MQNIMMQPIGYVKNRIENKKDVSWGEDVSTILLGEEYYPVYDKKDAYVPEWVTRLMEHYF